MKTAIISCILSLTILLSASIVQAQNVGVNTTTPEFDLDINGTTQSKYIQPGLKSASYEFFRLGNPNDYWGGIMKNINSPVYGDGDDFSIFSYGNRDIVLRAGTGNIMLHPGTGGNVGIGTKTPASKLDVNGDIRWGSAGASLTSNQGAAMELRGTGTPFIDFSNDATVDYDARFILQNNDRLVLDGAELNVLDIISAKRVKVTTTGYPDYVFDDDYELKTLEQVEQHIEDKGHLPGVPSEKEIVEKGLDLNDQSMWQMEKIEELFLHTIELNKQVKELIETNKTLIETNKALETRIEELEEK